MTKSRKPSVHESWAHLRFAVVGRLLADPPAKGEVREEIDRLAAKTWRHPVSGEPVRFGASTIERWYYLARRERHDPVTVLRRKVRRDRGQQAAMGEALRRALLAQYAAHKGWTAQLHYDNLVALREQDPAMGEVPSYSTVRRFLKAHGLERRRRVSSQRTPGAIRAEARRDELEIRSYENAYVNGLWHWDFHHGSKKVLTTRGDLVTPLLFGVLDDRSRLACHLQWYFDETAEVLVHGLSQAIQKRGLPRSALTDNGSAMRADEVREGLARLGVVYELTLPHSPYQNGKQENFWAQVEGRLLAMLEDVHDLTLDTLNDATQAWVEHEYNRKVHTETGETPIARFLAGPDVTRPSPDSAALRLAFTRSDTRTQRKSDGTVVIEARRFEVPSRYRHLERVQVRYASWDLTQVHLVDAETGTVLCRLYPLDRTANANGERRRVEPVAATTTIAPANAMPPLLAQLLAKHAATGLPPAYLPKDEGDAP